MQAHAPFPLLRRPATRLALALLTLLPQLSAHGGLLDEIGGTQDSQCGVTMSCVPDPGPPGGPAGGPSQPPGGGYCGADSKGNTCGGSGTASTAGQGGVDVGAGNPINLITGNKYQQEVDLPPLPGTLGIEIVRHYNSLSRDAGQLGWNWKLSYETDLYPGPAALQVLQADGRRLIFSRDPRNPSLCQSANPSDGKITVSKNARGQEEFTWTWTSGKKLFFNAHGKLDAIMAPDGQVLTLQHGLKGELLKVTDPQHRSLVMRYGTDAHGWRGIVAIQTPVGRFEYVQTTQGQGAGNLAQVKYPGGAVTRSYHYSDTEPQTRQEPDGSGQEHTVAYRHPNPHLLTGISVQGTGSDGRVVAQRIATWAYNRNGKAILSTHADNVDRVTLDFSAGGKTVLTNSLGQKTLYRHAIIAGEYRLLEAIGPGCALCGPTNIRYRWNSDGQLEMVTHLSEDGRGSPQYSQRYAYDRQGRIVLQSRRSYDARTGKPVTSWQWTRRYAYAAEGNQPIRIARPSVVPGKEAVTVLTYNDKGQITQRTESGFSPVDDKNQPIGLTDARQTDRATPLVRTTTYHYATIGGKSLLTEIDGPLPNGSDNSPADSDLTRAEWDKDGNQVIAWTEPGNFRSRISYDSGTGRLARVIDSAGFGTAFIYDALGRIERFESTGPGWTRPQIQSIKYDAFGNPTERGSGSETVNTYRPQTKQAFDASGRLQWKASASGVLDQYRYDTENHLTESGRYSHSIAQINRYAYDLYGRLTDMADNRGARIAISYDSRGRPARLTDALGRVHAMSRSATSERAAGNSRPRQLIDDFGRVVATISPDSGVTIRRFDAANRLIGATDAQGNRAAYEYDAAGRITRQRITEKRTGETIDTVWRYQGRLLVAIEHPTQSERYRYDERGLLIARSTTRKRYDGRELTSVTRYVYRPDGELQSVSLPDGSVIEYERDGQGQVIALNRSRVRTSWLRWLLPADTLVKDIERDIVGIRRYTTGNGIEARTQRSREGVLARVAYRRTRSTSIAAGLRAAGSAVDLPGITAAHAGETAGTSKPPVRPLPGALGLPVDVSALIDHRYLWDAQGNLLYVQDKAGIAGTASFAYDAHDRLLAAVQQHNDVTVVSRYFHDSDGRRLLSQEGVRDQHDLRSNTKKVVYQPGTHRMQDTADARDDYDANGQPTTASDRNYIWDALGRLREVRQHSKTLARYVYNHRGERIGKEAGGRITYYLYEGTQLSGELDAGGKLIRQYVYLADQPIAVIDTPQGRTVEASERDGMKQVIHDLEVIVHAWFGHDERIVWLHANHLGAIEAASGADGQLLWQASYQPFGQVKASGNGFMLNLRLPGQYEDKETGLYYNGRRYYDPNAGRYLTPDPLGTPDGPDPYAYVRGSPLRYVDPNGLILFAFDGTGNTKDDDWLAAHHSSKSNVWQFRQLYADGQARYITGVGTIHHDEQYGDIDPKDFKPWLNPFNAEDVDMAFNYSGPARIERMVHYFDEEADAYVDDQAMEVDIVGFSRGSAQARDFANYVVARSSNGWYSYSTDGVQHCQKVNFRFMGLFDTVLSTNRSGSDYSLSIPDQFAYVAQAVALNEHRGYTSRTLPHSMGAFPLESIMGNPIPAGATRIERGFIGAHADIGGGFGKDENQLSQVALVWMLEQAKAAGVKMDDPAELHTIIADPVVHDKSNNQYAATGHPVAPGLEDRVVSYQDGKTTTQMAMTGTGMTWVDTQKYISYLPADGPFVDGEDTRIPRADFVTGTVDMKGYLDWLNESGYGINLKVQ